MDFSQQSIIGNKNSKVSTIAGRRGYAWRRVALEATAENGINIPPELMCCMTMVASQNLRCPIEDAAELIEEVAKRESGVFLWFYLIVRSLFEGLTNGDRL